MQCNYHLAKIFRDEANIHDLDLDDFDDDEDDEDNSDTEMAYTEIFLFKSPNKLLLNYWVSPVVLSIDYIRFYQILSNRFCYQGDNNFCYQ
ncbi:hypothetical protein BpHYR1_032622 [Brachionus plicatilis]|uniref:Uncharacterized protein n=1 Tax=Brachionus plicatilis TaxID=10195 RepID=A0A3M7QQG6_BRAPC|nr:hypothetical protein BpHYR1_032622 [Brachionus plicatilis]